MNRSRTHTSYGILLQDWCEEGTGSEGELKENIGKCKRIKVKRGCEKKLERRLPKNPRKTYQVQ
jgi:hypothetical protein